jgi:pimeloyl-ACP methyl ester carboxylesterase
VVETETLAARDGTALLTRRWPTAGTPWATLLVVHGLGEHSGRHEATAGRFAAAGIATASFDHRGFGASAGRRADVERWASYLDDVEDRLAASRRPGLPSAIYGHSLGGLLLADYLLDGRPLPDAAILTRHRPSGRTCSLPCGAPFRSWRRSSRAPRSPTRGTARRSRATRRSGRRSPPTPCASRERASGWLARSSPRWTGCGVDSPIAVASRFPSC